MHAVFKTVSICFADIQITYMLTVCGIVYFAERLIGQSDTRGGSNCQPQEVASLSGYFIEDVVCGAEHTLVLTSEGDVWGWGNNSEGQLGLGHTNSPVREPQLVPCLTGKNVRQVKLHLPNYIPQSLLFFHFLKLFLFDLEVSFIAFAKQKGLCTDGEKIKIC